MISLLKLMTRALRWTQSELDAYLRRRSGGTCLPANRVAEATARESTRCVVRAVVSKGGKRSDLDGRYFRSMWEANYARYLKFLAAKSEILSWDYECKVFEFPGIKRGATEYRPDFLVVELDGSRSWHEVKGWMDPKSQTRIRRMAKYFPDEKLVLIDRSWFRRASEIIAGIVPGWEFSANE